MNSSIMLKLFFALFANIGILIVLINADFGLPESISGKFWDVNWEWHYVVGVPILTLMITNIAITMVFAFLF